jgi:biopolymer transport protein ExbD
MQDSMNSQIQLAVAPHGKPIEKKDPREIKLDVDAQGNIYIARTKVGPNLLSSIVKKAAAEYGQDTPIVIRGDANAKHSSIETAMNACTEAGVYKIKFAVLKEKGR